MLFFENIKVKISQVLLKRQLSIFTGVAAHDIRLYKNDKPIKSELPKDE